MQIITATFQAGRIELPGSIDWPDGTQVEIRPLPGSVHSESMKSDNFLPKGFFESLRAHWGTEAFERPSQGELQQREDW
ncbi:hypothetical protein Pr1d_18470 [Bythopirellula goksoeyrii]|uniref:Uncharacterized protein n=1 Tax=Bythopirellula goksoeyrii TaxID=1400387 RepID=A0A5B9QCB9_9BACT|nr:hypothetical protein Pr1d_18470 [Bythopirellula goksoeyrii]